jgi:hypothetical protein
VEWEGRLSEVSQRSEVWRGKFKRLLPASRHSSLTTGALNGRLCNRMSGIMLRRFLEGWK